MGEIKFRAWNKISRSMVSTEKEGWAFFGDCVFPNYDNEYDIMQFTGLKDKNGKDIYFDSDEVEYTYETSEGEEKTVVGIVHLDLKFTLGIIVKTEDNCIYSIVNADLSNIEIIGTIHENPEQLEK